MCPEFLMMVSNMWSLRCLKGHACCTTTAARRARGKQQRHEREEQRAKNDVPVRLGLTAQQDRCRRLARHRWRPDALRPEASGCQWIRPPPACSVVDWVEVRLAGCDQAVGDSTSITPRGPNSYSSSRDPASCWPALPTSPPGAGHSARTHPPPTTRTGWQIEGPRQPYSS